MRLSVIVLTSLLLFVWSSGSAQDKSKSEDQQREAERQPSHPAPSAPTVEINIGAPSNTEVSDTHKEHSKGEARPFITGGEGLIATITAIYVVISYFTFRAIKRQAQIAKDGTDALIAVERAWITVTIGWSPLYEGIYDIKGTSHGQSRPVTLNVTIRITYKNEGKTPAWIVERRACLKIFESGMMPEKPPLKDAPIIHHEIVSLAAGEEKSCDTPLSCEGMRTWDNLTVIYGVIKYRTVIPKIVGDSIFGHSVLMDGRTLKPLEDSEWNENS